MESVKRVGVWGNGATWEADRCFAAGVKRRCQDVTARHMHMPLRSGLCVCVEYRVFTVRINATK